MNFSDYPRVIEIVQGEKHHNVKVYSENDEALVRAAYSDINHWSRKEVAKVEKRQGGNGSARV